MKTQRPECILSIYQDDHYADCYTIFINEWHDRAKTRRMALTCNDCPTSPNMGISQFTSGTPGRHCGSKVKFESLPENVQKHIVDRLQ